MKLPDFRYVMILVNKENQLIQYPYYTLNNEFYEKLQTHIILGVLKIRGEQILAVEHTPTLNINSASIPRQSFKSTDKIWRYIDFYKFKDLIESSSLYMSNLTSFKDNLE